MRLAPLTSAVMAFALFIKLWWDAIALWYKSLTKDRRSGTDTKKQRLLTDINVWSMRWLFVVCCVLLDCFVGSLDYCVLVRFNSAPYLLLPLSCFCLVLWCLVVIKIILFGISCSLACNFTLSSLPPSHCPNSILTDPTLPYHLDHYYRPPCFSQLLLNKLVVFEFVVQ